MFKHGRADWVALVEEGLTVAQIAQSTGMTERNVRRWLRELGLRAAEAPRPTAAGPRMTRECQIHGETDFVRRGDDAGWRCLRCRSEAVTRRRRRVKEILVAEAGGACCLCGYDRFIGALEFHHQDPSQKRFSLSQGGVARSLEAARAEAAKCILVCGNCHAEIEAGLVSMP
jgi:transposase-like protein